MENNKEINNKTALPKFFFAVLLVLAMVAPVLRSIDAFGQWLTASAINARAFKNSKQEPPFEPVLKQGYDESVEIDSLAYLSAFTGENGVLKILAEKNSEDQLPIASVTKLMTALIVLKNYGADEEILISKDLISFLGGDSSRRFLPETKFRTKELFRAMLIESNNDAAAALMGKMGREEFISQMNEQAKNLGMLSSYFVNPIGLDPKNTHDELNYSSASDILKLVLEIKEKYPQIMEITTLLEYAVHNSAGHYNHTAISTNKFLQSNELFCDNEPLQILGGKTGFTDLAKKNLILITESPKQTGQIITIVLNAGDNFEEMKKMVDWICRAYEWNKPVILEPK